MPWYWRLWGALLCAYAVLAQRDNEGLLPRGSRVRVSEPPKSDEPSCDQLKAMWRFSKRQARAPEIMNEVNSFRDPLMYNEWPAYTALPRAAPRFRYQYPSVPREAFGRVVTKAPPNVVRTPDYDEMFGMLNVPHTSGKILRYPGPSRPRGPTFMVPPQRDRFEALKKLIRQEHVRELQRKYETEQKQKELATGRSSNDEYPYYYGEQEQRGLQNLQAEYGDDPSTRHNKKPQSGSRQVSQFSRYSDVMLPPARRAYQPLLDYVPLPYAY
ncbi:uncharacterized protein LOC134801495 [Cydia splendana]|uniref:uncharacterized protein LOC134801495 n=1 Tax=Cydia splendana TaxID=1100963 RepID=UPI00212EC98E